MINEFPDTWRQMIFVHIPKNGRNSMNPDNYCPIVLTSCLRKIIGFMISKRLTWFLKSNRLTTNLQSGFYKKRGTMNHLIHLKTFIREAFIKKGVPDSNLFDLEKAWLNMEAWHYEGSTQSWPKRYTTNLPKQLCLRNFKIQVESTLTSTINRKGSCKGASL